MQFTHFSRNGQIFPIDKATIPLSNIEYSYGFGVYETLRFKHGVVYFLKQHIERLFHSAEIIGLTHLFTHKEIETYISDLVEILNLGVTDSCNLKILLIGGKEPLLFIFALPAFFQPRSSYKNGVKTITMQYERQFPKAKTLNMLSSFLAYKKAKEHGCFEALSVSEKGEILEGTRTNFFVMKDTTLFIPPKGKILEGVTLKTVLHVARENGFSIEEKEILISHLSDYDGAFLTSTSSKILPISEIDSFSFLHVSENLRKLMKLHDAFLENSKGIFSHDKKDTRYNQHTS